MSLKQTWTGLMLVAAVAGCGGKPAPVANGPKQNPGKPEVGRDAAIAEVERLGARTDATRTGYANEPGAATERDAEALLKAVQEKTLKANSLCVGVTLTPQASDLAGVVFSGEVRAKGSSQWLIDFVVKNRKGLEKQARESCDGVNVGMTGFRGKAGKAYEPERYSRQLRDWCATSFVPIFFSLMYGNIDQGDDNLPKVSGAKSLGWQKVGEVDARVVEYVLTYPTATKAQVKAWIDPVKMFPLRREVRSPAGLIVETITSFELDPETPDSVFLTPDPTKVDKVAVPNPEEKSAP
jgi:hypothetical protein